MVNGDLAGHQRVLEASGKGKVRVERGAHTLIVEHTDALGSQGEIELQLRAVHHSSTRSDNATSNISLKLGDVETISGEREHAVTARQSERRSHGSEAGVDYLNLSLHVGIGAPAVGVNIKA